ncbi:unnamed protein product [Adineta steineri]|uniref:Transglutaminase-like domain-containing protein n=1 Tax=Adineta steineri TaxID=433720 RepID=A0A814KU55_9BILA|nr:unnamed protein product [Adineta steineri]CAF1056685.1 unnamed protein product [Adineta steineri]CAF1128020.1 unnamed protein product [Adineta steineri]
MGCTQSAAVYPGNRQGDDDDDNIIDDSILTQSNTFSNDDIIAKLLDIKNPINIQVADSQAFNKSLIQQRQQAIDNASYRSTIETWTPNSLQQLSDMIKSFCNGKSIVDQHWIIFYWITFNIEYDTVSYFTKNYKDQSSEGVFQNKKGVCAGYANIYKHLCDQIQLPCETVVGYSKGYGFEDHDGAPTGTDHAWNAVQIDNHWYLMESTWGAGILNDKKAFERQFNSYYFLPRPNEMIYHHLPEDKKWQLLETSIDMDEFMQMPKLRPPYFDLNLELINPYNRGHVDLLPDRPHALVLVRVPSDVQLIADLKLNGVKLEGAQRIMFDSKKQIYCCYFAPATTGEHKITVYAKRNNSGSDLYDSALELVMNINQIPTNPISFPRTWDTFFDLNLEVLWPQNTNLIKLNNTCSHARVLIRTPTDVELFGRLKDANQKEIINGNRIYWNKEKDIWVCSFAPDRDGIFEAAILAKKKSDPGNFTSAVSFTIEAKQIPIPNISYPNTWSSFYDLGLKIQAPKNSTNAVWNDDASYTELLIQTPDDVQLSCDIKYNNAAIKHGSLAQFNNDKKLWQLLFAPECTGLHELVVYGKRISDTASATALVKFGLNVTKLQRPMKFPAVFSPFQSKKCQINTPLDGILKNGSVVPISCVIPDATGVDIKVDSEWLPTEGYTNPNLERQITVGSKEVLIFVKYDQGANYLNIIKYTVE